MIRLIPVLAILLLLATGVSADETEEPTTFRDMSLTELQAVDTGDLSKAERRLHKAALKAAKKAEKKRLKEEKKRLRRALKHAEERLRYAEGVRARSTSHNMETDGDLWISGASSDFNQTLFSGNVLYGKEQPFYLGSYIEKTSGQFSVSVLLSFTEGTRIVHPGSPEVVEPPEWYWREKGGWPMFTRAMLYGGKQLPLRTISRDFSRNGDFVHATEKVSITLDWADIEAAVSKRHHLDFKLFSDVERHKSIRLPFEYLVGYGMRLAEVDAPLALDRDLFEAQVQLLKDAAAYQEAQLAAAR